MYEKRVGSHGQFVGMHVSINIRLQGNLKSIVGEHSEPGNGDI